MAVDAETRARWNKGCEYKEHYVVLMDIMGASSLVNDPENNSIFAGILSSLQDLPANLIKENLIQTAINVAVISDTVVVSANIDEPSSFPDIIQCVCGICKTFISEGILLRGAICQGNLYHRGNVVFGPALVEAHQLEQTIAIYPRIILSPRLPSNIMTKSLDFQSGFVQDFDGTIYLDIYTDIVFHAIEDKEDENLNMIQDMITHYLTMPSVSARIKQKYEWLKEHFNYSLRTLHQTELIENSDYQKWLIK